MKRSILGVAVSSVFIIAPTIGNIAILRAPHLWILLVIGVLASVLQPGYNPFTIGSRAGDAGTGAQIIWSVYLTQLAAIFEATYLRYPRSIEWDAVATVALVVAALGFFLRTWAVFALGDLFTMHVSVNKNHQLVRAGPYAVIRHPSYLGAFLLYLATTVFLHSWLSALAAAIILPVAFLRRIQVEEAALREKFGTAYESYCSEVRKILPGIW